MIKPQRFDRYGKEILDDDDTAVMRDGEVVRVPMMLMDGMQREIAERAAATGLADAMRSVADANAEAGARQVAAMADNAAEVQRHLDELRGEDRARAALLDRDPRQAAYDRMCDDLGYHQRGAA